MLLHEANARLKTEITGEQLDKIHMVYCLLDLEKDDFCKIVDAVGVDTLMAKTERYNRLHQGKILLDAKEKHERNKKSMQTLDMEMEALETKRKQIAQDMERYETELQAGLWSEG